MPSERARSRRGWRSAVTHPGATTVAAALGVVLVAAPIAAPAANAVNPVNAAVHGAPPDPFATKPRPAHVSVSVATVWIFPKDIRPIDRRALTNPVRIGPWTRSLDYSERMGLHGRVTTQVLLGTRVVVVGARRDWRRIQIPSQVGGTFPRGVIGWVPRRQLSLSPLPSSRRFAAVTARHSQLRRHDAGKKRSGMRISYGTRLPVTTVRRHRVWVHVPGWRRSAWLPRRQVVVRANGKPPIAPTRRHLVAEARKFRGLPFLWAGLSSFGFDCSGFAESTYRMLGITLPRDSADQAARGRPVRRSHLRRGDLIFFSSDGTRLGIHHTAIYAGHGRMLQSPHTGVRISSVRLRGYDDPEYWGARRYLH